MPMRPAILRTFAIARPRGGQTHIAAKLGRGLPGKRDSRTRGPLPGSVVGEMSDVFNEQRLIAQVAHRMVASLPEYLEELAFANLFLHLHHSRGLRRDCGDTVRRHPPSPCMWEFHLAPQRGHAWFGKADIVDPIEGFVARILRGSRIADRRSLIAGANR